MRQKVSEEELKLQKKTLLKKLENENEDFYMDTIIKSKPLIYSRAEEIFLRQKTFVFLKEKILMEDEKLIQKLLYLDNILDETLCFIQNHHPSKNENFEKNLEQAADDFLETLR